MPPAIATLPILRCPPSVSGHGVPSGRKPQFRPLIAAGRFRSQIVPVEIPSKKGAVRFEVDEHVRAEVTAEQLAQMKPVFKKDGTVTVGNSSGLNDGAAALVLAEAGAARRLDLKPLARLVGYAHAGVDPD